MARTTTPADMLRAVLATSGLSQLRLAAAMGADPATFRRWIATETASMREVPDVAARLVWILHRHPGYVAELAEHGHGNTLARLLWLAEQHPRALAELNRGYDA